MGIGRTALWLFLLPGNLASDAIGAHEEDDRAMIRTIVNMLAWNIVATLILVAVL